MFTTDYHLNKALVADRQQTLRNEARQHHLARLARRARPLRRRVAPPAPVALTTEAPTPLPLPPAAALAAWHQDHRAA